jgi:hypothetical protein
MSQFAAFALSFGGFLALTAAIAAWLFRSTTSPLWLKIVMPALMMALACYAPYSVPKMMGYPVSVSMQGLPDQRSWSPSSRTMRSAEWIFGCARPTFRALTTRL